MKTIIVPEVLDEEDLITDLSKSDDEQEEEKSIIGEEFLIDGKHEFLTPIKESKKA